MTLRNYTIHVPWQFFPSCLICSFTQYSIQPSLFLYAYSPFQIYYVTISHQLYELMDTIVGLLIKKKSGLLIKKKSNFLSLYLKEQLDFY